MFRGFSSLDELIRDRGEIAVSIGEGPEGQFYITAYQTRGESGTFSNKEVRDAYLNIALKNGNITGKPAEQLSNFFVSKVQTAQHYQSVSEIEVLREVQEGRLREVYKYKPVDKKIKPHLGTLPQDFRIVRDIKGNPLEGMPQLPTCPPEFEPRGRYTEERKEVIDKAHPEGFLWKEERKLVHWIMSEMHDGFAWDDTERGRFKDEYFPPVDIPIIEHTPWVLRNIPIPPGLYEQVCEIIRKKIDASVYEPSNSSYRSQWFTILKKDGKSLRIVHSLEPLNKVTIAHSSLPPATDHLAGHFSGRACGSMFDLYVGYDERTLAVSSRDPTTFQTPYGAMRLVTLPMGWTNSVPIFHDDVTHILEEEIPHNTILYIDDMPVRGPESRYEREGGGYETIPANEGIRRFVWEHLEKVVRVIQRMRYAGRTFSGFKSVLCADEITVVGYRCTYVPGKDA